MLIQEFDIATLIARYVAETISEQELEQLNRWRNESPGNEALFKKLCNQEAISRAVLNSQKYDKSAGWSKVDGKIRRIKQRRIIYQSLRYAALILAPLAICYLLLELSSTPEAEQMQAQKHETGNIIPGKSQARLILDNGKVIDLSQPTQEQIKENDGTEIKIDSAALNYKISGSAKAKQETAYNKLEIPRGGEYKLYLSDGSIVYLNSMSSLHYPVQFNDKKREVELTGEAYFEVQKSKVPFIVKTKGMNIEVLGTKFNVSAYNDDPDIQTTLVSGSVKVNTDKGGNFLLKPSQQARLNNDSHEVEIRKVDVSLYTSWVNGKIYFKDKRIEDIIKVLSRWYNVSSVTYEDDYIKNLRFGCNIDRYNNINPFFELLEQTGKIDVEVDDKTINLKHIHP